MSPDVGPRSMVFKLLAIARIFSPWTECSLVSRDLCSALGTSVLSEFDACASTCYIVEFVCELCKYINM